MVDKTSSANKAVYDSAQGLEGHVIDCSVPNTEKFRTNIDTFGDFHESEI